MRRNRFYKRFSSIKTTVWLLGILCAFFLLGTVFPQGESYSQSGGALIGVLIFIDVLNIFSAPLFMITAGLLFVNQLICSYERLRVLLRKSYSTINEEVLREDPRTVSLPLPSNLLLSDGKLADMFNGLGLRLRSDKIVNSGGTLTFEKGLNPYWPSWVFHTFVLVLLASFAVSYLFAFEGELSLTPGSREEVSTRSSKARWYGMQSKIPGFRAGKTFQVGLKEFITEYTQFPKLQYPSKGLKRLSLIADIKGDQVSYTMPEDSLFPKDWKSRLVVFEGDSEVKEKTIEVNDPLRHRGVAFYQMDIGQKMTIAVGGSDDLLEVKPGEPFQIPGIEGVFQVKMLRAGTLFMKDGNQTPIKPNTALEMIIENENGKSTKRGAGRLILHEPLDVQGIELTLQNWQEVSILSYRYNPGRPILWVSALALLAAMTFRIWAYWYRIEYLAAGPGDNRKLYLRVMHNGLLADSERIIDKIRSSLQKVIS